jgi:hypothetical protein
MLAKVQKKRQNVINIYKRFVGEKIVFCVPLPQNKI